MNRSYPIYLSIIFILIAIGLPSRIVPEYFPGWFALYAGDFLWATVVFFLYCLVFKLKPKQAIIFSLCTAYIIEIYQLFYPEWLQQLRQIKIISLVIGHGFLWSDLIAYTFGIAVASGIDYSILKRNTANEQG